MRDFRASAKASRLIGGVWALGITTWAQPGQRTLDQEKQKQTGGAGKATQRVRVGGRSAAARRLARGRAPRTDTQEMDVSCGGGADDDDGGR